MHQIIPVFKKNLFAVYVLAAGPAMAQSSFPTPPQTPERLFYIQRTGNNNTIVYDANTINQGREFNKSQPVRVYWLRYDERGQVMPLNYLQRTLAYGVKVSTTDHPGEYVFHIVSYPKSKLKLLLDQQLRPRVQTKISGRDAWLNRVFVNIEGKKIGIIPNVKYVELFGTDARTGKPLYEKFVP